MNGGYLYLASKNIRLEVFKRDNYICQYCAFSGSDNELNIGHIIPKSMGGTSTPDNLVTMCRMCSLNKSRKELKDYLAYSVYRNTEYFDTFKGSIDNIHTLLEVEVEGSSVSKTFYQLLFANVIASMETYLSDAFIITVLSKKEHIRKLIETDPEFQKRKIGFSEIFKSMEEIQDTISDYLLNIIYHNVWKVKSMYSSVLEIKFPDDLESVSKAVMMRHDIIHRNGKQKDGTQINIGKEEVLKCIKDVSFLIGHIDKKIRFLTNGSSDFIKKKVEELEDALIRKE
ncbi:hypothetical protein CN279_04730 [Bacillus anthracis]|nr:hypothetical protein CN279_04730 [Bacillus anthracis]